MKRMLLPFYFFALIHLTFSCKQEEKKAEEIPQARSEHLLIDLRKWA